MKLNCYSESPQFEYIVINDATGGWVVCEVLSKHSLGNSKLTVVYRRLSFFGTRDGAIERCEAMYNSQKAIDDAENARQNAKYQKNTPLSRLYGI